MKKLCNKGDTVCLLDYPRSGLIETTVISSGSKYIRIKDYPYLLFDAETLYNKNGGGKLFIGSAKQYAVFKEENAKKWILLDKIKTKLSILSKVQLQDILYQIEQMID